jgi:phosphatidylglycerophosphate synthase
MAVPSIRRLRVICQKEKLRKPDDLTRKHRAVSIYATWLLVRTNVTADQVTVASIATGLCGAAALAQSSLAWGLAGVLLCYLSFLFDQVDGEVARYWRRSSLRGVYLDELRHLLIYAAPVFALAFPLARALGSAWPFAVAFAGALGLALARIEERLPAMMFGERAGKLLSEETSRAPSPPTPALPPSGGGGSAVAEALRAAVTLTLATYEVLAHQVLILVWLLVAVVVDRGFGRAFGLGLEGALLIGLSFATCGALLASIRGRTRPGELERDVKARAAAARPVPVAVLNREAA